VTGKVSGFDLGLLNVQSEAAGGPGENFGVARVRKELFARSYVGAMLTTRRSDGSFNRVAAVDARFVLKRYLNVAGLAARSVDARRSGRQWAKQLGAEWRDDLLEAGVNYIDVDPDFEPGIGFVRRRDRLIGTRLSVKPRPRLRGVRQLEFTPSAVHYHDDAGDLVSRDARFQFVTALQSGDRVELEIGNAVERLVRPFRISQTVSVNPGRYEWNYAAATLRSFNGRKASGTFTFNAGDFYSGTKRTIQMAADLRPGKNLSFSPAYTFNDIDLREESFDTHLFGLRANVSFTTNVLTSAFLQYNSAGDLAALQLRLNYIFRTIDNVYLVFNETRFTAGVFDGRSNRSLVFKTTYSIHR
jgi:hypothetical protein